LALTAHNNMQLATAAFDNVTISGTPPATNGNQFFRLTGQ
jgi:hypothetical protein